MTRAERNELESKILAMVIEGKTDKQIKDELPGCSRKRIESVRQKNGLLKQKRPDLYYHRIDDFKDEEKPVIGQKVVIHGDKYIDITGDIVDCGTAYRGY